MFYKVVILLIFSTFFSGILFADLEDHLKKITDKSSNRSIKNIAVLFPDLKDHLKKIADKSSTYSMENIDFIYIINLDQRPEKYFNSISQLLPYEIYPYRFSAVNGWELTLEEINDVGLKFSPEWEGGRGILATSYLDESFEPCHETIENYGQTYFSHCMARGTIGIALSHISVLQDAFESGYETIWVMEDDIWVVQDPRILSTYIEKLDDLVGKGNWDILYTDRDIRDANGNYAPAYNAALRPDYFHFAKANNYGARTLISSDFRQIGARFGTTSMIIRRSGMKKLLQFFKAHQIYCPIDMDLVYPKGIKLFTVTLDVVTNTPGAPSDNGGPYYLEEGK